MTLAHVAFACATAVLVAACGPAPNAQAQKAVNPPAARVPNWVLTRADSGRTQQVEAGDSLEVRLPEAAGDAPWRLASSKGDATVIALTPPRVAPDGQLRVFAYRVTSAGQLELVFDRGAGSEALHFLIAAR